MGPEGRRPAGCQPRCSSLRPPGAAGRDKPELPQPRLKPDPTEGAGCGQGVGMGPCGCADLLVGSAVPPSGTAAAASVRWAAAAGRDKALGGTTPGTASSSMHAVGASRPPACDHVADRRSTSCCCCCCPIYLVYVCLRYRTGCGPLCAATSSTSTLAPISCSSTACWWRSRTLRSTVGSYAAAAAAVVPCVQCFGGQLSQLGTADRLAPLPGSMAAWLLHIHEAAYALFQTSGTPPGNTRGA